MTHFDHARLVDVGDALDWDLDTGLAHLISCPDCRQELEFLGTTRHSVVAELQPRPGFTDEVMAGLEEAGAAAPASLRAVNAVLAALVTFFVLAVAGGAGAPLTPGAGVALASLLAGVIAFARHDALTLS